MCEKPHKVFHVYMKKDEYEQFLLGYNRTIYRSRNQYAKKLLLAKPVTIIYRNRSLDDFVEIAVKLRKDLRVLSSRDTFTGNEKEVLTHQLASIEKRLVEIVDRCGQI